MILDSLTNGDRYAAVHPLFQQAFDYLRVTDWQNLPEGKHVIDGEKLYVMMQRGTGRGKDGAKLEVHRRYIDIQYTIAEADEIGWKGLADCRDVEMEYTSAGEAALFADRPETWLHVPAGHFAIFFPEDAHAPLGTTGTFTKAVVKVEVV
ncbi:MAG: YhcH/YjgK/YiaL family protein [Planctomycetota bacterium]|nr:YhcH/YjgK/YiaL family protein [Planctomycetota bacterium]